MEKDEIFKLLGRNLATFQKIEIYAKAISETVSYRLEKCKPDEAIKVYRNNCGNFTLGQSIPEYLKIYDKTNLIENNKKLQIDFKLTMEVPECGIDEWKNRLNYVKNERNWLVHKSVIDINCNTEIDGRDQWKQRLDQQYNNAIDVLKIMEFQYKSVIELRKEASIYISAFTMVSLLLSDMNKLKPDEEGWILFQRFESHYNRMSSNLLESKGISIELTAEKYIEMAECEITIKKHKNANLSFIRFQMAG